MVTKRIFDIILSLLACVFFSWFILLCFLVCTLDTSSNGLFLQKRVGQYGKVFTIYKLRTIKSKTGRVSSVGSFLRKYKIDEFPQFFNVLFGDMSFVGPRPDVCGYYDLLEGENRKILQLKPGITSFASIKYANEESILSNQQDPLEYNDRVIFPDKVKMNLEYYYTRSFWLDMNIILKTFIKF